METTVRAALRTVNYATSAGTISASVATLTEGMLKTMFRTKLKSVVAAVLSVGVLAAGIGLLVHRTAGAPAQEPRAGEAAEGASPQSREGGLTHAGKEQGGELIVRAAELSRRGDDDGLTGMVAIDPKTGKWRSIFKGLSLGPGPVSPDGRYIVYSSLGPDPDEDEVGIWVYDMKAETIPRRIFERRGQPFWTNNGRQVVIGSPVGRPGGGKFETWRVNADGSGRTKLPVPETDLVLDCSADGTWLATRTNTHEDTHRGQLTLIRSDGSGVRDLTEGSQNQDLFSVCQNLA